MGSGSAAGARSASRSGDNGGGNDGDGVIIVAVVVGFIVIGGLACCAVWWMMRSKKSKTKCAASASLRLESSEKGLKRVAHMAEERLAVQNGVMAGGAPESLPPPGRYVGTFKEGGRSRIVLYDLIFSKDGSVVGTCEEEEGACVVKGIYDSEAAMYRWGEMAEDATYKDLESDPSLYASTIIKDRASHIEVTAYFTVSDGKYKFRLAGQHCSSTGATGALEILKKE